MNQNFAERFKAARSLKGFSLQDVANLLGNKVTRQALYRYEKGEVLPNSEMLADLAKVLEVHPDFFFRTTKVEIEEVSYRKLQISAKEEARIKSQTKDYLSRYLEIEEILGIREDFVNPLADEKAVSSFDDIEPLAEKLRKEWGFGYSPLSSVAELLENNNIKVLVLDVDKAFDGLQTFANGSIPVIAYNKKKLDKPDRIRFTLLHELGHLLLKFDDGLTLKEKERLCNHFAGELLLPKRLMQKEFGVSRSKLDIHELSIVKKEYGASMQAIVMRANSLGIVSDYFKKYFFELLDENGWRVTEPVDCSFNETPNRFKQLVYRAMIEELISFSKAAALQDITVAELRNRLKNFE